LAECVRCGWADVGDCLPLTSEEMAPDFLGIRRELYDLCFPESLAHDPRLRALVEVVRSAPYRLLLGELPGYECTTTGALESLE
jgi:molybdate-binding protein